MLVLLVILFTILVFILDYFPEKLMTKFQKNKKKPILGPFWTLFPQSWAKINIPGKKGSVSIDIPIIYHHVKN